MRSRELPQVVPRRREAGGASQREDAGRDGCAEHRRAGRPEQCSRRARTRRACTRRPRQRRRRVARSVDRSAPSSASIQARASPVETASASASPVRPASCLAGEREGHVNRQHAEADRAAAGAPRPATKTSGKVTEYATDATMYGDSATTSRPIWAPTSSPYALPRTRPAISAPATAKMPAVAPTTSSAGHDEASTCRAMRRGSRPSRVRGTAVTSPSDDALTPTTAAAIRYA